MSYHQLRESAHVENDADPRSGPGTAGVEIGLNAAIVAVADNEPVVLIVRKEADVAGATDGLAVRSVLAARAPHARGRLARLGAPADRARARLCRAALHVRRSRAPRRAGDVGPHVVSIGYLALTQAKPPLDMQHGAWRSWYQYFPWEDWRRGRPEILEAAIEPRLREWAARSAVPPNARPVSRQERVRICFGLDGAAWDEEKVLERYELLYEAGLVEEARPRRPRVPRASGTSARASACRCASITGASWRRPSAACAPRSSIARSSSS